MSNVSNQGITRLARPVPHAGRAHVPSVTPTNDADETKHDAQQEAKRRRCPPTTIEGAALSRGGAALSRRRLHARALSAARRLRRRGRGAGMLSARVEAFPHLSRAGDQALAVRDPAQCLQRRICAARRIGDQRDRRCARARRADAALAGDRGDARRPKCCAAATPPRSAS